MLSLSVGPARQTASAGERTAVGVYPHIRASILAGGRVVGVNTFCNGMLPLFGYELLRRLTEPGGGRVAEVSSAMPCQQVSGICLVILSEVSERFLTERL